MAESLQGATFHVEHIIPRGKGGRSDSENLALAWPGCNLHKASRITAVDPASGGHVRLFHPVLQLWSEHFRFSGYQMEGLTAEGRATVKALNLNHPPASADPRSRGNLWPFSTSLLSLKVAIQLCRQ
jgi:hypothetical protein